MSTRNLNRGTLYRALCRFFAYFRGPIVIQIKETRSPDWDGDAARRRGE